MNLNDQIRLWNYVSIHIVDVRHSVLERGEELKSYRLPASAFLYAVRGTARIELDRNAHMAKRFHVLHGGKGLCIDIIAEESFEYYLILYKATLPLPSRREMVELMELSNPFHDQYAFAPIYPLLLFDKVNHMNMEWHRSNALEKLQVKSLFYQFVYELFRQLHVQGIEPFRPDLVAQAIRYIQEQYSKPVTLEAITQELECSVGYLSKLFKEKMNTSPIHYLSEVRVDKAAELLMQTDASLQEIAESVGYPDGHTLSRSFKRHKGVSPAQYRAERKIGGLGEDLPLSRRRFAILPSKLED